MSFDDLAKPHLARIAEALERMSPPPAPAPDLGGAEAFVWHVSPDRLIPVEAGLWYDKYLPNSRLVVYDGIGHLPHEEAAQRSAAYVAKWLDEMNLASAAN